METKTMSPSTITAGQIGKIQELLSAGLRKSELQSEPVQQVIETQGEPLVEELVAVIRKRVEAIAKTIRRQVRVDRNKTAAQAIDATNRHKWYIDQEVLEEMPVAGKTDDTAQIFELDYDPSVVQLDQEYEARGLRPDPFVAAQVVVDDQAFADDRPLAVQWRDSRGRACYAIFNRSDGQRRVSVGRNDRRWNRSYRFVGVRK